MMLQEFHLEYTYGSRRSTVSCEHEKRSVAPAALTTGAITAAAKRGNKCILDLVQTLETQTLMLGVEENYEDALKMQETALAFSFHTLRRRLQFIFDSWADLEIQNIMISATDFRHVSLCMSCRVLIM
jgi:hypothetical protein